MHFAGVLVVSGRACKLLDMDANEYRKKTFPFFPPSLH